MKFEQLDEKMRLHESTLEGSVIPGITMIARLDGRGFTKLTKEIYPFEAPFDEQFHHLMVATTQHLMQCGFQVIYGYTQSDEISLLLHRDTGVFDRKPRKYISVLAAEASAKFSLELGGIGVFDARLSLLPNIGRVISYFQWRMADAHRNALHAHCYWMLRKQGNSISEATLQLQGMSVARKNDLLFRHGINFNALPTWQKRGTGVCWEHYQKTGINPISGQTTETTRRRVRVDNELPIKEDYRTYLLEIISNAVPEEQ